MVFPGDLHWSTNHENILKHLFFLVFSYVYIEDCCHLPKPPTSNGQEAQPSYPWRIWRGTLWTVPRWGDLPSWRWGWGMGWGFVVFFFWDPTGAKNGDVYCPTSAKVMGVGIEWPDRLLFLVGGTRILFRRDFWKSSPLGAHFCPKTTRMTVGDFKWTRNPFVSSADDGVKMCVTSLFGMGCRFLENNVR